MKVANVILNGPIEPGTPGIKQPEIDPNYICHQPGYIRDRPPILRGRRLKRETDPKRAQLAKSLLDHIHSVGRDAMNDSDLTEQLTSVYLDGESVVQKDDVVNELIYCVLAVKKWNATVEEAKQLMRDGNAIEWCFEKHREDVHASLTFSKK